MCGILGWILPRAQSSDCETLARLTDLLSHRGPDGAGYWVGKTANDAHQIALGHRRLSIIDMAGGAQPMWSADRGIGLIHNGEIYNYNELREELRARGHVFVTQSDTEVVIEAYRAWGTQALARLRGMFAFALWDSASQTMLLARDAFGKKPLFLFEEHDRLVFASEIAPLLEFPGVSRDIEPDALGQYLLNRYVPGPSTFFRAIKKLQPGCYLIWKDGRARVTRYFTPPLAQCEPDLTDFGEAVRQFSRAFDEAVRIRMRSDAPYGAYLSGGIDSSAIVAAMSAHAPRVRTFSVGFRDSAYSELDHARAVAAHFGSDHGELVVEPDTFMEHWPLAVCRRGAPVSEASDIPILMLSKLASRSVKMVLTGEGADEMLGGYPKHRAERWVEIYQRLVPAAVHERLAHPVARALPYEMRRLKILADVAQERDPSTRMRTWFGGIGRSDREALLHARVAPVPPCAFPFSLQSRSALRRTLFFDQTSWLPDNLLERGDRMMMAASIEGRMPFMDTTLALLAARIPDHFHLGASGGKAVLRAAMRKVLPSRILVRRKIGFRVPLNSWFRGHYRDFLRDMLTGGNSRIARLFDRAELARLTGEHIAGRRDNERILWTFANLELFLREFEPTGLEQIS